VHPALALVGLGIIGTALVTFAGGPAGQSQMGTGRTAIGIPQDHPAADRTPASRGLQSAVRLVQLDSCDPAVLARPPRKPVDMKEAAEQARTRAEMEHYQELLTAYAEGDSAASIDAVIALSRQRLARDRTGLTSALASINKRGLDPLVPWDARRYASAVMLHTDAGLRLAGDTYGRETYDQFQVAADLLQLGVTCAPDRFRALAPRWYVALSRVLRDRTAMRAAEALLEIGRTRLEGDPAILLESGLLAESIATIFALSQIDSRSSWVAGGDGGVVRRVADRRQAWLNDALAWLKRASELEPGNDDVLLHLGRVRALRFEDAEALSTLRAVLERTSSDETAYLAGIFIGAVHDRQDRLGDAIAAYRAAVGKLPGGHAGRVGLADVLRRSGRLDDARQLLLAAVTEGSGKAREPLWWYILEPPGMADDRLAALRTEVRR